MCLSDLSSFITKENLFTAFNLPQVAPALPAGQLQVKAGVCPASAAIQVPPPMHGFPGFAQGSISSFESNKPHHKISLPFQ